MMWDWRLFIGWTIAKAYLKSSDVRFAQSQFLPYPLTSFKQRISLDKLIVLDYTNTL